MFDKEKLESVIKSSGVPYVEIAAALDVSLPTLRDKRVGNRDFKLAEITALQKVVNMSDEDRNAIFFGLEGTDENKGE